MTGVLLGKGCLKTNGKTYFIIFSTTLMNILWSVCIKYGLISKQVKRLFRIYKVTGKDKKKVYYFQTLTVPYFTFLSNEWCN